MQNDDNYVPDPSLKMLFTKISKPELIVLLNALFGMNIPLDAEVDFKNTEHFQIIGTESKNSVRGDIVAEIKTDDPNVKKSGSSTKIVVEFQSTKNNLMGFRIFIYSINVADIVETEIEEKGEKKKVQVIEFPKAMTIYTTPEMPKEGLDEVYMKLNSFRVGETEYSGENGELLVARFPYMNLWKYSIEELNETGLDILQATYL